MPQSLNTLHSIKFEEEMCPICHRVPHFQTLGKSGHFGISYCTERPQKVQSFKIQVLSLLNVLFHHHLVTIGILCFVLFCFFFVQKLRLVFVRHSGLMNLFPAREIIKLSLENVGFVGAPIIFPLLRNKKKLFSAIL